MAQIKAVIFDLDGTVCNTLQDLAECTNRALADYGLPGHTVEAYKKIVGNGVDTQMRRAIGEEKYTKELADKVKAAFKAYYDQDYLKNTKPYEGMPQALDELKAMGLKIAVFSNKPDEFAGKVCTALFGDRFDLVAGNRPGIPVKPDPAGLFLRWKSWASPRRNVFTAAIPASIWTPAKTQVSSPSGWSGASATARSWRNTTPATSCRAQASCRTCCAG